MAIVGDPVGSGFINSLARPGGNVTGVSNLSAGLAAKRLQLLKEAVPSARQIAVLFNPDDPVTTVQKRETERAAPLVRVAMRFFPVRAPGDLVAAFGRRMECCGWRQSTLMMPAIGLAAQHRLPTMVVLRQQVQAGGLMSYNSAISDQYRRAAIFVDKILRGAQPTKFEFVVKLKTAKARGIAIPPAILLRADELVE